MDDIHRYHVSVIGWREMPFSRHQSAAAYARLLHISVAEAWDRLVQLPLVVRSGLCPEEAQKYQRVLERMGFVCRVEVAEVA
jgi:hypothetical protein